MYANELEPFFLKKIGELTPLTYPLHFILRNMIEEYANKEMEAFNQIPVYYEEVEKDINMKFLGLTSNRYTWVITADFIISICFPKKDKENKKIITEPKKSKNSLSILYRYFDKYHREKKNLGTGAFWIAEANKEILAEQIAEATKDKSKLSSILSSADLIDEDFEKQEKIKVVGCLEVDFYLGVFECQWCGIFNDWHLPNPREKHVANEIIRSFDTPQKVAAIIWGDYGTGKSTFLRSLAKRLIRENMVVVWVKYTNDFISNALKLIDKIDFKFTVFIEEWSAVDDVSVPILLEILRNSNNIRLVIGNNNKDIEKLYDLVLYDNFFEVTPNDNEKILERVSEIESAWAPAIKSIALKELNRNPIYIVLFIISRNSSEENFEKTGMVKSRFKKIVESDLKKIAGWSKGFAIALYYWASIYSKYRIYITWKALLAIADHYNGNKDTSEKLINPENNTFSELLLKRYLSFNKMINPDLNSVRRFRFNHYLLALEGLAKSSINIPGCIPFSDTTYFEIAEILIEKEMFNSAHDLVYCLLDQEKWAFAFGIEGNLQQKEKQEQMVLTRFLSKEFKFTGLRELDLQDEMLDSYYRRSHNSTDTRYFAWVLNELIYGIAFSNHTLLKILKSYIKNGCKVAIVHKAYVLLKQGKLMDIEKMLDSALEWQEGFLWHNTRAAYEFRPPRKFVELDKKAPVVYTNIKYWEGLY